jgi:hypothetical protein
MSCTCVATLTGCNNIGDCSSASNQLTPFYGSSSPDGSCEKLYGQVTCCSCESVISSATVPSSCSVDDWWQNPITSLYVTCSGFASCNLALGYDDSHNMGVCTSGGTLISISESQYQTEYWPSNPPSSNSAGAIAGIVIGCIAAIAIIVGGVLCWRRRKNRRQANAIANDNKGG